MTPEPENILILGSGFAGWYAAQHLAAILPLPHKITLVDRVDHMLYTPMLTEVAGGTVRPDNVAVPAEKGSSRVAFVRANVSSVDVQGKVVTLDNGRVLHGTQIILAIGSSTSYHGISGAKENSVPMKTLADAVTARNRVDQMVEAASRTSDPLERRKQLTLVVAGGGYTGVETIAALNVRLRNRVRAVGLTSAEITSILVEPEDGIMRELPESLGRYGVERLQADGIRVMTGTGVRSVEDGSLELTNGETIRTGLLIWDTGIEPSPLLQQVEVPKGKHHGVLVDDTFRVPDLPGVWAIGDCAEIPKQGGKGSYAPTAQNAVREGKQVARNIVALLKKRPLRPFRYTMLGQLALLGGGTAAANILDVPVRGPLAWALWWAIYTAKLPDMARRVSVARDLLQRRRL